MIEQYHGLLNPSSNLDLNNWGATIVCDNKGSNHARIVFEMINIENTHSPEHFFRIAQLCGTKITDLKNLKKTSGDIKNIAQRSQIGKVILDEKKSFEKFKPYKCSRKSPTYIATREKIEALIEEIQDEADKGYPFNLAGRRSFLARNADLFKICDPLLAEIESVDQDLFIRLYDSVKNECLPTGMGEKEFSKRISDSIETIRKINPDVLTEGVEYDYEYLLGLFDEEMIFQITVRQQSCFTWAKMKLESIGVEFKDLKMDKIISITRVHLKNHMEEDVLPFQVDDKNPVTIRKREKKTIKHSITYDVDRDRRTETKKKIDNLNKKEDALLIAGSVSGFSMIAFLGLGIGATASGVAVPILFPLYLASGAACLSTIGLGIKASRDRKNIEKKPNLPMYLTSTEYREVKNKYETKESKNIKKLTVPKIFY